MTKLPLLMIVALIAGCADTDTARRGALEAEVAALRAERDAMAKELAALKAEREAATTAQRSTGGGAFNAVAPPLGAELIARRDELLKAYATCKAPCAAQFSARIDDYLQRWDITERMLNACVRRCQGDTVEDKALVTYTPGEGDAGEPVTPSERQDLLQHFKRCKAPCAAGYVKHPETIVDEDARRCFMMEC